MKNEGIEAKYNTTFYSLNLGSFANMKNYF